MVARPEIVSADDWERARADLLVAEKQVTHAQDALAARRRRLPMVRFRGDYLFASPTGRMTLLDLFEGRSQLFVYQFMDVGPDRFCPGCTWTMHGIPQHGLDRLAESDTSWVTASDMPLSQMQRYWTSMGWAVPFASSRGSTFLADTGAGEGFLLSVFLRDGHDVYRTYTTGQRGIDRLVFQNSFRDLLPFGRQEEWEDSPAGWPQHPAGG